MNIIVTGSRGFIGSHLVKHLKKHGHVVTGINKNPDKIANDYFCADLGNISEVSRVFSSIKNIDLVIHAAGVADPRPSKNSVIKMIDANIKGASNLCQYYTGKIINLSSVTVYGNFSAYEKMSEMHQCYPKSPYAATKLAAEHILDVNKGEVCHLRLGAVTGQNLSHGAIFDFQKRLVNEEKFYAIGKKPGTIKPYLYISDLLEVIDLVINMELIGIFNVVPDDKISIEEVVIAVQQGMGIHKEIIWDESQVWSGDNSIINTSNNKLKSLGWHPKYTSYESVLKCVIDSLEIATL